MKIDFLYIYYVYIYICLHFTYVIVQEGKFNGKSKKDVVKHIFGVISCCQWSVPRERM